MRWMEIYERNTDKKLLQAKLYPCTWDDWAIFFFTFTALVTISEGMHTNAELVAAQHFLNTNNTSHLGN